MIRRIKSLGLNYIWGVLNFTGGVALGGSYVALALIAAGAVK